MQCWDTPFKAEGDTMVEKKFRPEFNRQENTWLPSQMAQFAIITSGLGKSIHGVIVFVGSFYSGNGRWCCDRWFYIWGCCNRRVVVVDGSLYSRFCGMRKYCIARVGQNAYIRNTHIFRQFSIFITSVGPTQAHPNKSQRFLKRTVAVPIANLCWLLLWLGSVEIHHAWILIREKWAAHFLFSCTCFWIYVLRRRGTRESMQDGGEREKVQWENLSVSVRESG